MSQRDIFQILQCSSWIYHTPSLQFIERHMTKEGIGETEPYETIFERALRSATIIFIR